MVNLSIIVPTMGRDSLRQTLISIDHEINSNDEVIVVADGSKDWEVAQEIFTKFPTNHRWHFAKVDESNWGNAQRNYGIDFAAGTHISIMDDDDVYRPGAFEIMRKHAADVPVIFKMHYEGHYLLWKIEGALECGNYGTPCFLIPNRQPKPHFTMHYAGDADYIAEAVELYGEPVWRPEIIAEIRPGEAGIDFRELCASE